MEKMEARMSNNQSENIIDEEEKEILDSFESDLLISTSEIKSEKINAISAAKNFLKKSERINIRMNAFDLSHIKRKAAQEGIPYQTLISSILHKYASRY